MPLPRLIPCLDVAGGRVVKGVRFEGLTRGRRPGRARRALLRLGRGRARVPRREGDARRARRSRRARRADRRSPCDPVHRRRRRALGRGRRGPPRGGRRQGLGQQRGARATRACSASSPDGSARRPSSSRSTPRGERCRTPGRHRGRKTLGRRLGARGRRARGGRDPAHVDRRRRHAGGLRPRAHRVRERGRVGARDRIGRSGQRASTSPRRSVSRRRRSSRRSSMRTRRAWSRCATSCGIWESRCAMPPELRAAIVQDAETNRVLMLAWMDDEALRLHARDGRGALLQPLAAAALAEGRDVRQHARGRGAARRLRRRRDPPARATGRARVSHRRGLVLRAVALASRRRARAGAPGRLVRRRPRRRQARPRPHARSARKASRSRSAGASESDERLVEEIADLWFHTYVLLAARGLDPSLVEDELVRRATR